MSQAKWLSTGYILLEAALISASPNALAALWDRGGGMVFDDNLQVTWLADANFAKTSGFDADGKLDWYAAHAWVDGLVVHGYSDWRLPSGNLNEFYALSQRSDLSMYFVNIRTDWTDSQYWYAEEYSPDPSSAQQFYWTYSRWNAGSKLNANYVWALRDGDVAPVPEPETYAMLLAGLALVVAAARPRERTTAAV